MANPNLLWVRDAFNHSGDVGAPIALSVDLLWKARTGNTVHGSNLAVAAEQPGTPRELYDRPLAPQDISGALVKRIFLAATIGFASIPPTLATDQTQLERWVRLGIIEGINVSNSTTAGYTSTGTNAAETVDGSVTIDWMHWRRRQVFEPMTGYWEVSSSDPTPVLFPIFSYSIDCKAQRRLKEWDDTVRWTIGPNDNFDPIPGETMNHIFANWSVLLEMPR